LGEGSARGEGGESDGGNGEGAGFHESSSYKLIGLAALWAGIGPKHAVRGYTRLAPHWMPAPARNAGGRRTGFPGAIVFWNDHSIITCVIASVGRRNCWKGPPATRLEDHPLEFSRKHLAATGFAPGALAR
jgi:hypothetical protein